MPRLVTESQCEYWKNDKHCSKVSTGSNES